MDKHTLDPQIKQSVTKFIAEVRKNIPIQTALVFGSQAKGTAKKWSDIDICLVSDAIPDNQLYEKKQELTQLGNKFDDRIEIHLLDTEEYNNKYYTFAREVKTYGIEI